MLDALQQWAAGRGYRVACGDIRILREARSELEHRRQAGELDSNFAESYLTPLRHEQPEAAANPRAVILVALRRPAHRLTFELESGPFDTILPPTYLRYSPLFEDVRAEMVAAIPGLAGHLSTLRAPLKLTSCRLGLSLYGRNNVTYIPGWGSYFQLCGYITDAELGLDDWQPQVAQLMPDCEACGLCASACPTGAINDDRVLLHAECCTTYFSEKAGDLDRKLSGRCLFGCLECQEICPANEGLLRVEPAGVSFNLSETKRILAGTVDDATPESAGIRRKFELLGLTEKPLIGRNLAKLIGQG